MPSWIRRTVLWPVAALIRWLHRERARYYERIADDMETYGISSEGAYRAREQAAQHWRLGGVDRPGGQRDPAPLRCEQDVDDGLRTCQEQLVDREGRPMHKGDDYGSGFCPQMRRHTEFLGGLRGGGVSSGGRARHRRPEGQR